MGERFDSLMGTLGRWCEDDHADNISLHRSAVIDLIEGVKALRALAQGTQVATRNVYAEHGQKTVGSFYDRAPEAADAGAVALSDERLAELAAYIDWDTGLTTEDEVKQLRHVLSLASLAADAGMLPKD